jgi:hypothetical protein
LICNTLEAGSAGGDVYRQACPASAFTPSKQLPAGIIFELQAL